MDTNYLSPKFSVKTIHDGYCGVFSNQPVAAGEIVCIWGGRVVDWATFQDLPAIEKLHSVQVEENFYLITPGEGDSGDCINHACAPNCGLRGQITLVAMRDIAPGEEATMDYAMSDGSPYAEFDCECGAPHCRGRITGEDWRQPALWERYKGYFSPYIQQRIDRLRQARPAPSAF